MYKKLKLLYSYKENSVFLYRNKLKYIFIKHKVIEINKLFNNKINCINCDLCFKNDINIKYLEINNSYIRTYYNNYNIEYLIIYNLSEIENNRYNNNINCTKIKIYLNNINLQIDNLKYHLNYLKTNNLILYINDMNYKELLLNSISNLNINNIKIKIKK